MENTIAYSPVKTTERNFAIDVMRGVAVLEILLLNIPGFTTHAYFLHWHDAVLGKTTIEGITTAITIIAFDGKMRGLFTILFGAGLMLFIDNKKNNSIQVADVYFRRMLWLLAFGFIDSYLLLWTGDILYEYALCGMLLFGFRNLRVRYMILVAITCLTVYTYFQGTKLYEAQHNIEVYESTNALIKQHKPLTEEQEEYREQHEKFLERFIPFSKNHITNMTTNIMEQEIKFRSSYSDIFLEQLEVVKEAHTIGFYDEFLESFATILLGMALYKLRFFNFGLKPIWYKLFCFVGIPLGLVLGAIPVYMQPYTKVQAIYYLHWCNPLLMGILNALPRIILIIGYASLLLLLSNINWLKRFLNLFANVGRMAFTNYIMQTIMCSLYFFGFGLNHYGIYTATQLVGIVFVVWVIQITYSNIYLHYFKTGPLEWLWRQLTYGKKKTI